MIKPPRNNERRLSRIFRLLRVIRSGQRMPGAEFTTLLGVSRRTFYRDLKLLSACGVKVIYIREEGRYFIDQDPLSSGEALTHKDVLSLIIGLRAVIDLAEPENRKRVACAVEKVVRHSPALAQQTCRELVDFYRFCPAPFQTSVGVHNNLKLLELAHLSRLRVRVVVSNAGNGAQEKTFEPRHVEWRGNRWCLLAYDVKTKKIESFDVANLKSIEVLNPQMVAPRKELVAAR